MAQHNIDQIRYRVAVNLHCLIENMVAIFNCHSIRHGRHDDLLS